MNHSNLLRRLIGGFLATSIVAIFTFSSCTQTDTLLGNDLTLEDQALKIGQMYFSGLTDRGNDYFESRLYRTDSLNSACLSSGYLGTMGNDTFGMRQAGFYTQYNTVYALDEDEYGFMPIYDSAMLYLSISGYGGDTSVVQQFEVYEVVDISFITESTDSIFFPTFDISPYLAAAPVFTFTFPDQDNDVYTTSSYVKLEDTDMTEEFMDRLMLKTIDGDYDYEIYDDDEEWVEQFKGLYIRPVDPISPVSGSTGAMYAISLSESGFSFIGRSREEDDPTLIKDTIGMTYSFYSYYADAGNISINCIEHDYTGSLIDEEYIKTPERTDVPTTSILRVEGMAGVVSEITFAEEFFEQLDTIFEAEEAETGEVYTSLFFNQATLKIYMEQVTSYDSSYINPFLVTEWMDYMPSNLGLYTTYSNYYVLDEDDEDEDDYYLSLTGVADYPYAYESSYTLDFSGAMNRSWCCYVLNISSHIQSIWNSYLTAKEEAEEAGTEIDWDSISGRSVYLGLTATNLFGPQYASMQAGDVDQNATPMELSVTYTMIR